VPSKTVTLNDIICTIRDSGRRVTNGKRAVADVLRNANEHLNVEEIVSAVRATEPDINQSTVYRILEEFEELGLVVHSHLGASAAVYHLAGQSHAHLVCDSCGATQEIPASQFDEVANELFEKFGFTLDRHHVALSGLCASCREKTKENE
jgi:Fur family transcriptional regulator, ferric uptake regulator